MVCIDDTGRSRPDKSDMNSNVFIRLQDGETVTLTQLGD